MTAPQPVRTHRSALATRPLWLVGLAATVAGAAVAALVAAVARAADVPLEVASSSDAAPEAIPVSGVAVLVVICGIVGLVMALGTNRWATRPARAFVVATTVLTAVSLVTPLIAENATTATRVVLELTHLVVAAIIIPPIAYRLAQRSPRP
ncbi:MAG TPA: DUF6069 family protein [Acidimicrobiales bacterium]|jgi:hypothetical protein